MTDHPTEPSLDLTTPDGLSEVEARVRRRAGRQLWDFAVVVLPGGLILRGRARSYYAKQVAQHVAREVTHLPVLANEIVVS